MNYDKMVNFGFSVCNFRRFMQYHCKISPFPSGGGWGGGMLLLILFLLSSCTPEKKLKESEFLLVKNKIVADNKAVPVAEKITYVVQPRPNKRTFGLFLGQVGIYQAMIPVEKPHYEKFKRKMRHSLGRYPVLLDTVSNDWYVNKWDSTRLWLQGKFGEPPVLLDSSLIDYSVKQINLMMEKIGYFNANTTYSVSFAGRRATVLYKITAGIPYRITDIQYSIADAMVARIILADTNRSLLQRGNIYDEYVLDNERSRIEERLLNRGYFNFSRNNIRYEADTSLGNGNLSLRVIVQNQLNKIDDSTVVESNFRCYKIQSIDIYIDDPKLDYLDLDTVFYTEVANKTDTNTYRIFLPVGMRRPYKSSALVYPLFFGTEDVYSKRRSGSSYDRYSDMRNFGYTKISYIETADSKENYQQDTGYLDCKVQLVKLPRRFYDFDFFAKNTGGIYGLGVSLLYGNRNLFKAAEILSFGIRYTQELQIDPADSSWHFRNFEAGVNVSLEFPRFLFPIKQQRIPKNFRPKTLISVGANYIRHNYFSRFLITTNFTYNWMRRLNSGQFTYHTLSPIDFGLIKMYDDSIIQQYNFSDRIKEKYKNHFMLGSKYGFTIQRGNVYVFRTQANLYGNVLYALMKWLGGTKAEKTKNEYNQYTIWDIPFESCVSVDFDFVYNLIQQRRRSLVYHLAAGVGVPMFNSSVIPYEKSFYLGGSNSMRGWRLRALGPGSFIDTSGATATLERVGDIKFETNLEYRIPVYRFFTLGTFVDIGNIWLIKESKDFVNGEFAFNRFYKELAINAGVGLRLDFSFFIIRIDYALKIHDPAKLKSNGWQTFNWSSYKDFRTDRAIVIWIGYPF